MVQRKPLPSYPILPALPRTASEAALAGKAAKQQMRTAASAEARHHARNAVTAAAAASGVTAPTASDDGVPRVRSNSVTGDLSASVSLSKAASSSALIPTLALEAVYRHKTTVGDGYRPLQGGVAVTAPTASTLTKPPVPSKATKAAASPTAANALSGVERKQQIRSIYATYGKSLSLRPKGGTGRRKIAAQQHSDDSASDEADSDGSDADEAAGHPLQVRCSGVMGDDGRWGDGAMGRWGDGVMV